MMDGTVMDGVCFIMFDVSRVLSCVTYPTVYRVWRILCFFACDISYVLSRVMRNLRFLGVAYPAHSPELHTILYQQSNCFTWKVCHFPNKALDWFLWVDIAQYVKQ